MKNVRGSMLLIARFSSDRCLQNCSLSGLIFTLPHYLSHFSLTVVDSDGASNSTTASLTVNKAVDYPPVANAGPNQVITLPQNSITLYGNQSTDDHGIVSYEWSLSPNSKVKVAEMQVRSPGPPFQ